MKRSAQRAVRVRRERDAVAALARGREHYERRRWAAAYRALSLADRATVLDVEDIERLALSAYLVGRDDDYLGALERAHRAHLAAGDALRAARCGFWLGLRYLFRGESGPASGWLARAQRLLQDMADICAEKGYLLLPAAEQSLAVGDCKAAYDTATRAVEIGETCGEADLVACARHLQGRVLLRKGRIEDGFALLDEAMVAVTADELSPIMTGLIYCSVIDACQQIYALDRAGEWTDALARWCEGQSEMVAFAGVCRVHRAEVMQLRGAWPEALEEAHRACARSRNADRQVIAAGLYQQAEVHRLRGELVAAERSFRSASRLGAEVQPGLALLRLAQGRREVAAAGIRRALSATVEPLSRARLLPAYVEILLESGEVPQARDACDELARIAGHFTTEALRGIARQARGAVELAEGDAQAAATSARRAFEAWQDIDAPYLAARARLLRAQACRAVGDGEGAEMELEAAKAEFERLGAAPDLARIEGMSQSEWSGRPHGLTARELQVLRLVAAGKTNKAVAAELSLSERTIDRHVSNIFNKLDVPTRAAATGYAYRHKLI